MICHRPNVKRPQTAGDSTDTSEGMQEGSCSCSSTSSASSIQTQLNSSKNQGNSDSTPSHHNEDILPETPRHLLELGVSLSSPNLLHSSVGLTNSSSSSDTDVSKVILVYLRLWDSLELSLINKGMSLCVQFDKKKW